MNSTGSYQPITAESYAKLALVYADIAVCEWLRTSKYAQAAPTSGKLAISGQKLGH